MNVQALFVDTDGIYPTLLGAENCWGEVRDARTYGGTDPVVAHPPCQLWVNMAAVNYARAMRPCTTCADYCPFSKARCRACGGSGRRESNRTLVAPAWYPDGTDGGCFAHAVAAVRRCGGVLEHPAGSHAWDQVGAPYVGQNEWAWDFAAHRPEWVEAWCEVWQSAYGHAARKRTWLYYCGRRPPPELQWAREPGTHQVGWFDRVKPTLSKRAASATPVAFAQELIALARWSRG